MNESMEPTRTCRDRRRSGGALQTALGTHPTAPASKVRPAAPAGRRPGPGRRRFAALAPQQKIAKNAHREPYVVKMSCSSGTTPPPPARQHKWPTYSASVSTSSHQMDPAPAGGPRRPRDDELASIDAQATYWLENIKPNSAQLTYATYETYIRVHIRPHLGKIKLDRLTVRDVQARVNKIAKHQAWSGDEARQFLESASNDNDPMYSRSRSQQCGRGWHRKGTALHQPRLAAPYGGGGRAGRASSLDRGPQSGVRGAVGGNNLRAVGLQEQWPSV
ncbi:MAG: hypothetical protein QOI36_6052 [Pseudonocardiales bacterium]|nr:hypothetical protein [Pseudonocardiales bacterium]